MIWPRDLLSSKEGKNANTTRHAQAFGHAANCRLDSDLLSLWATWNGWRTSLFIRITWQLFKMKLLHSVSPSISLGKTAQSKIQTSKPSSLGVDVAQRGTVCNRRWFRVGNRVKKVALVLAMPHYLDRLQEIGLDLKVWVELCSCNEASLPSSLPAAAVLVPLKNHFWMV